MLPLDVGVTSMACSRSLVGAAGRLAAMAWASALELLTELPAVPVFQTILPVDDGVTSMASVEALRPSTARGDGVGVALELLTELPAVPVFRTLYYRGRRRHVDGVDWRSVARTGGPKIEK